MNLIEIPDIHYKIEIPSEFSEMTMDQFVYFAGLSLKFKSKLISLDDLKTLMVMRFLNVKSEGFAKLTEDAQLLVSENINRMKELLGFLFIETENGELTYDLSFTRNLVPFLKLNRIRRFKGPADALTDISFLEYKDANTYFRSFNETSNEADLNRMIAVLYRPARFFKKQAYNPDDIELRAWKIGRLPMPLRWAVYLFYASCENFLKSGTLTIDGNEISLDILYKITLKEMQKAKAPKYDAKTGLAGVALSLAATGVFGPIDKVYSQNLYDVILLLYKQRIEYLNELENLPS
ncbi:MAG: hypothetical protein ACOYN5_04465 [Bacteroidales bacterium]